MEIEEEPYFTGNKYNDFNNRETRLGFIKKVYGILAAQLFFTAFFTVIPFVSLSFKEFMYRNIWIAYLLMVVGLAAECAIICCKSQARTVPNNYILLGIFTFSEAWITAFISSIYKP
jgi:FtsH-binding integral membrane protein